MEPVRPLHAAWSIRPFRAVPSALERSVVALSAHFSAESPDAGGLIGTVRPFTGRVPRVRGQLRRGGIVATVIIAVVAAYLLLTALLGAAFDAAVWFGAAVLGTVAGHGIALTLRLRDALVEGEVARAEVERRATLQHAMALMTGADTETVYDVVADALVRLGFDAIAIVPVDDEERLGRRVVERGALAEVLVSETGLLEDALARTATARRAVVMSHRGRWGGVGTESAAVVAAPLRVEGATAAVAIAVRVGEAEFDGWIGDAVEQLIGHAGRNLAFAHELDEHRDARADLELRDDERALRLRDVAREVAGPLAAIRSLALAANDPGLTDAERGTLLDQIGLRAGRAGVRLADLVDIEQARSRIAATDRQAVILRPVVESVVERLDPVMRARRRRIDVPADISVDADPLLLPRLLEEVVIEVARRSRARDLEVIARADEQQVAVEVRGSGPHVEDVLGSTTPTSEAGSRLARELIQAHGSELTIRAASGVWRAIFVLPPAPHRPPVPAPRVIALPATRLDVEVHSSESPEFEIELPLNGS